jgi:uncharacterized protein YlzI (FlbEa/FlbD family)
MMRNQLILRKTLPVILMLGLLLIQPAAALTNDAVDVTLLGPIVINGSHVNAGNYQIRWVSNSPDGVMTLLKGRKVVAEARGKAVERDAKAKDTLIITQDDGNGNRVLKEIQFKGKTQAIVFD